ncbi:MAG TPA: PH domain-containing protein [Thermoanaerobaculia bacterium]|nr:PH domain-containing protein [Thermoanaerobaculia bacterium]
MTETFRIAPGSLAGLWLLLPVSLLLMGVLVMLAVVCLAPRRVTFEVGDGTLRFHGDLYGKPIRLSELQLDQAQILDLAQEPGLLPRWRTAGTALGRAYNSGWFRLRNGEKALLYLTRRERVLSVPTTLGYRLLLSPESPEQMLASLRSHPSSLAWAR